MRKLVEKELAINLRRKGLSYNEILTQVPVAKSTLSLWISSVGLSKKQKQRLTEKKLNAMRRGWTKAHEIRLARISNTMRSARKEARDLSQDPLWLLGTALYWAEGSKIKSWRRGERVIFSNMDSSMILIFIRWLKECLGVSEDEIGYEVYIHENSKHRLSEVINYWSLLIKSPNTKFKIYFKKHRLHTQRHNIDNQYFGLLRVFVRKSGSLNHKITGWIEGLSELYCRVV